MAGEEGLTSLATLLCVASGSLLTAALLRSRAETDALPAALLYALALTSLPALLRVASGSLLTVALLRSRVETDALPPALLCTLGLTSLPPALLLHHAESETGLCAAPGHHAESEAALRSECCLCVHDAGCADSGEEYSGDCKCENLVHSSLLVICRLRFAVAISSGRCPVALKNASFPPIQRPASSF